MARDFGLDDEHPLSRELASLQTAVKHYEVRLFKFGRTCEETSVDIEVSTL